MKLRKKYIIIFLIVFLLLSCILSFISCTGLFPAADTKYVTETTEALTGWRAVLANYGTWLWCIVLLLFFITPAIVIISVVNKKSVDKSLIEEKKSQGLNPKNKTIAVILSIFFSFWSWLYTYKINFKKFWIAISICLFFWILTLITILTPEFKEFYSNYGTWISLPCSIAIWLWALIDNSTKPLSFYINYPKGFDMDENKLDTPILQNVVTDAENKNIFCMRCGTTLPTSAIYCKKCGQKV